MFFTWGNAAFLASVRHFCRVLRGVVFVNGLIQNSVNGLIQILRILRAVKIGVLVTAAGASSPSGFVRPVARVGLILPAGEMAKMSYYKKERGSSEPWRLSDKSAA